LCGAISFEIAMPTKWIAHCHCSMCRRAHGAAFVTWVSVPKSAFRLTGGEKTLKRYASSEAASRSFCGTCGSPLFFEANRWAEEIHIARAHFRGALDREPQVHAFFSDKAPWVDVKEDLPRRGGKTGTEPL
jgi:hypothetical protein